MMAELMEENEKTKWLYEELIEWKKRLGWIRQEGRYVKKNTRLWMNKFEKVDRRLKKVEKELDEMRFIISKDKRDKIIRRSENELKDVARDLNAVRKEQMEMENVKLWKKVEKIEDYSKTEKVKSEDSELEERVEVMKIDTVETNETLQKIMEKLDIKT